jgi:hypothetical protein
VTVRGAVVLSGMGLLRAGQRVWTWFLILWGSEGTEGRRAGERLA